VILAAAPRQPRPTRGAELLFQVITEREERASIAIATNLPFSEWGTVFPGPTSRRRHRRPLSAY